MFKKNDLFFSWKKCKELKRLFYGEKLSIIYRIILYIFIGLFLSKTILGQRLFIEQAESNVVILRDNLVRAKAEALKDAKTKAILQAVSRFLNYDNMVALEPLLLKYFLDNPDLFIESIRVTSEGNNPDLTEFNIKIETQIFRSRIISTFRRLGIPTQEEKIPLREVILIYNPNDDLRKKRILFPFLKILQTKFNPYRIRVKVVDIKDKILPIEDGLEARLRLLPNSSTKTFKGNFLPLLELKIELFPEKNQSKKGKIKTQLIFWSQNEKIIDFKNNTIIAKANLSYSKWKGEEIVSEIINKLMLKWTPVIKKTLEFDKEKAERTTIKFRGLLGPIEEQLLFKILFQNNPRWEEISLDIIANDFVTYQGIFLGRKDEILKDLSLPKDAPFYFPSSFLDGNNIVVNVIWKEIFKNLEPFDKTAEENKTFDSNFDEVDKIKPKLQVPLRTFKHTYSLPLRSPVFDHIRHRGDSTLFRIKLPKKKFSLAENNVLKISWYRIGPTNLVPKITLFDQNKNRINSHVLRKQKHFSWEYKLPDVKQTFFLRISDELGFLEDVAGSYQSFRYILSVN